MYSWPVCRNNLENRLWPTLAQKPSRARALALMRVSVRSTRPQWSWQFTTAGTAVGCFHHSASVTIHQKKKKKEKVDILPSLTSWFPDLWHNPILPWLTHNQFSFVQATAASRHSESQSTLPASSVFHDSLITEDCLCVEIFPLGVSDSRIISRQKEPKSEKGTCSHPNPLELIQKHLSQRLYSKHVD